MTDVRVKAVNHKDGDEVPLNREWAMPNKSTFNIKPINKHIQSVLDQHEGGTFCDPFVGMHNPFADKMHYSNDLNPDIKAKAHMKAIDYLRTIPKNSVDVVLFDPPYTAHQVNEVYAGFGDDKAFKQITMYALQITRIVKNGGTVINFGYNSVGIPASLSRDERGQKIKGKKRTGFSIKSVMTVCHGGAHNDTIVTTCVKDGKCEFEWPQEEIKTKKRKKEKKEKKEKKKIKKSK